jgi:hypothetical protein
MKTGLKMLDYKNFNFRRVKTGYQNCLIFKIYNIKRDVCNER